MTTTPAKAAVAAAASARSTHAAPLTYQQRADRYHRQNNWGWRLTARQERRITKKINHLSALANAAASREA